MSELLNHPDIHQIELAGKRITLIGTAHISQESIDLVEKAIEEIHPDSVGLELDEHRLKNLVEKNQWQNLNLVQIIKKKQVLTLVSSLLLSSYQRKLGQQTGVTPGSEMLKGYDAAKKNNIPIVCIDRDARITLKRAWRKTSFLKKTFLLANIFTSLFEKQQIDEEKLSELRKSDILTEMLNELGKSLPSVKQVLIDERDFYLATKIKEDSSKNHLAIVGAGHINGILHHFSNESSLTVSEVEEIPESSSLLAWIGWGIPAVILLALIGIGVQKGVGLMGENLIYWVVANGGFSALGALLALCHPITILVAFLAAPLTSLTPVIGAGYVTAFVQAWISPPTVKELHRISEDVGKLSNWWKNKALKVLLAFILPGLGSAVGTYVGGFEILKNFFK